MGELVDRASHTPQDPWRRVRPPAESGDDFGLVDRSALPVTQPPLQAALTPDQVLHLQRTAGNAAIAQSFTMTARRRRRRATLQREREDNVGASSSAVTQRAVAVQREQDDELSPEEAFLDDLDSGIGKAKEYLEYIPTAVEWWNKVGGDLPPGLRAAADNLARISTRISEGVDEYAGLVGKAKQALQVKKWADSVAEVAQATRGLSLGDKPSRDAWIQSVDRLGKVSGPFVDAAKDWLQGLAIGGGQVASRAFIVLSAFAAYAQIGWGALKAGLAAVEAYTGRFGSEGTEMKKVQEERPPEPEFPGGWTTAGERQAELRAARRSMERAEEERKRRERLAPFAAKVRRAHARIADAKRRFDESGFAKRYRKRRAKLVYSISREMRYGKKDLTMGTAGRRAGAERGVGGLWWDQLVKSGEDAYLDQVAGRWIYPEKEAINLKEAQFEIDGFRTVEPTCPLFNDIYAEELQKFTAKERAALTAVNEEYARAAAIAD